MKLPILILLPTLMAALALAGGCKPPEKKADAHPSPAKVDSRIAALMPISDLPSYPSEDAVLSGVTVEMLKVLFPAAVEEITQRAAEERNAALWSGKATASDIAAGLALGKSVAAVFVARAAGDGMRTAGGSVALWKSLSDAAVARGEIPWISQETPARPPMLAGFGQVRTWMLTPAQLAAERPGGAPPAGGGAVGLGRAGGLLNNHP